MDTWKAEEKNVSRKLHKKILALTLVYPPTGEFNNIFVEDMFLKPNPKGFLHVMHYLFTILDPIEFKKRFYWPIVDKKSESLFRTATVQYLDYLNEKYNLKWTQLKNYLVLMPGGIKFISFLSELVDFILKELIKQSETELSIDPSFRNKDCSKQRLQKMISRSECFKKNAAIYILETDRHIEKLRQKTVIIKKQFEKMSKTINSVNAELLSSPDFHQIFFYRNKVLLNENVSYTLNNAQQLEMLLQQIKSNLVRFQTVTCEIKSNTHLIQNVFSEINGDNTALQRTTHAPFEVLLNVLNIICPQVNIGFLELLKKPVKSFQYEKEELSLLKNELTQMEDNIKRLLSVVNNEVKKHCTKSSISGSNIRAESSLRSKFLSSPAIKLDVLENKVVKPRLPFLEEFIDNNNESFILTNRTVLPTLAANSSNSIRSIAGGSKSKIPNASMILQSVNKKTRLPKHNNQNLPSLLSKWKESEFLLKEEEGRIAALIEKKLSSSVLYDHNSFHDSSDMKKSVTNETSSDSVTTNVMNSTIQLGKPTAIQHMQVDCKKFLNLSTSPSGRLEPLLNLNREDMQKLFLKDNTLLKSDSLKEIGADNVLMENKGADIVNNINIAKSSRIIIDDSNVGINDECDSIFNTSDSILNL